MVVLSKKFGRRLGGTERPNNYRHRQFMRQGGRLIKTPEIVEMSKIETVDLVTSHCALQDHLIRVGMTYMTKISQQAEVWTRKPESCATIYPSILLKTHPDALRLTDV